MKGHEQNRMVAMEGHEQNRMDDADTSRSAVINSLRINSHWPVTIGCSMLAALALASAGTRKPLRELPWAVPLYQLYQWCFFTHSCLQAVVLQASLPNLSHPQKSRAIVFMILNVGLALSLLWQRFLGRIAYEPKFAVAIQNGGFLQGTGCSPPMQDFNVVLFVTVALLQHRIGLTRLVVLSAILLSGMIFLAIYLACALDSSMVTAAISSLAAAILMLGRHDHVIVIGHGALVKVSHPFQKVYFYEASTRSVNVGVDFLGALAFAAVMVNVSMSLNIITSPDSVLLAQLLFAVGEPCWVGYICCVLWNAWQDVTESARSYMAIAYFLAIIIFLSTVAAHFEVVTLAFHIALFDTVQTTILCIVLHANLQRGCFRNYPTLRFVFKTVLTSLLFCLHLYRVMVDVIGRRGINFPMLSVVQALDRTYCLIQIQKPCSVRLWWCFTPGISFLMCFASLALDSQVKMFSLRLEEQLDPLTTKRCDPVATSLGSDNVNTHW